MDEATLMTFITDPSLNYFIRVGQTEATRDQDKYLQPAVMVNVLQSSLLTHSHALTFSMCFYPAQGPGGSGAFPRNSGCDVGKHLGWDTRISSHLISSHSHTRG